MDDHGIYFKKQKKQSNQKNPMIIHFRVDTHLFIDHLPLRQNAFSSPRLGQKKARTKRKPFVYHHSFEEKKSSNGIHNTISKTWQGMTLW